MKEGIFITLEGIDGAGKSTLIESLKDFFEQMDREVVLTYEPCGKIREILLETKILSDEAELLLMEAARAEHVKNLIEPALKEGKIVLCDRFFDSTVAYQGYGREMDFDIIHMMNKYASCGITPHCTVLLDLPEDIGLERQCRLDRISAEGKDFMRRVRHGFLELAKNDERFIIADATKPADEVSDFVKAAIREKLGGILR